MYRQYTNSSYKTWLVPSFSCSLKWTSRAGVYASLLPALSTPRAVAVSSLQPFSRSTEVVNSTWIQIENYRVKFPVPIDPSVCSFKLRSRNCIAHCTRAVRMRDCVREMHKQVALFQEISAKLLLGIRTTPWWWTSQWKQNSACYRHSYCTDMTDQLHASAYLPLWKRPSYPQEVTWPPELV